MFSNSFSDMKALTTQQFSSVLTTCAVIGCLPEEVKSALIPQLKVIILIFGQLVSCCRIGCVGTSTMAVISELDGVFKLIKLNFVAFIA